ncbi:Uncharacterised protein [Chromobacterium violaceum]|uniref:Lipoprotein n=1 Tax=Chromobacterium violaceum TaxID=536 RepID=A0A3S4IGN7_CHRVL|nr:Uncharacterised protein [Chromobacterium violaceum]
MSAKNIFTVTITGFLLSACNQVVDEYSLKKNTKQIEKPEPSPTKADWDGALKKLIPEEKVSQEGNGTYSFASYPLPKNNLKGTALLGSRDEFRKIRHYRTSLGYSDYPRGADVNFYIALVDYGQPEFFVKPVYKGDSWLFFDRVQFLADGVVVIDKKFKHDELSRDYGSGWVYESADFIAGGDDIAALRVFAKSKILQLG